MSRRKTWGTARRSLSRRILLLAGLVIAGYLLIGFGQGAWQIWRLTRIKWTEERSLDEVTAEKTAIEQEIERLKTDSLYIEELARRQFGMVKEGETVFRITLPDSTNGN